MNHVRGRFAPSPTGAVHVDNVWTALLAWLDARQRGITPQLIIGRLAYIARIIAAPEPAQPRDLIGLLDWQRLPASPIAIDSSVFV